MRTEDHGGTARGPGWREFAGTFGVRWVARSPTAPSSREWNGSQSGQGATELGFPGPALGKMQGEAAGRAGDSSGEGERTAAGGSWWSPPAHPDRSALSNGPGYAPSTCIASQAALAAKRPDGMGSAPRRT